MKIKTLRRLCRWLVFLEPKFFWLNGAGSFFTKQGRHWSLVRLDIDRYMHTNEPLLFDGVRKAVKARGWYFGLEDAHGVIGSRSISIVLVQKNHLLFKDDSFDYGIAAAIALVLAHDARDWESREPGVMR